MSGSKVRTKVRTKVRRSWKAEFQDVFKRRRLGIVFKGYIRPAQDVVGLMHRLLPRIVPRRVEAVGS